MNGVGRVFDHLKLQVHRIVRKSMFGEIAAGIVVNARAHLGLQRLADSGREAA